MPLGIYAWKFLTDKRCFSTYIQVGDSVEAIRNRIIIKTAKNDTWSELTCELAVCPHPPNQYTRLFFTRPDGSEVIYRNLAELVLNESPNIYDAHLFNGVLVTAHDN